MNKCSCWFLGRRAAARACAEPSSSSRGRQEPAGSRPASRSRRTPIALAVFFLPSPPCPPLLTGLHGFIVLPIGRPTHTASPGCGRTPSTLSQIWIGLPLCITSPPGVPILGPHASSHRQLAAATTAAVIWCAACRASSTGPAAGACSPAAGRGHTGGRRGGRCQAAPLPHVVPGQSHSASVGGGSPALGYPYALCSP